MYFKLLQRTFGEKAPPVAADAFNQCFPKYGDRMRLVSSSAAPWVLSIQTGVAPYVPLTRNDLLTVVLICHALCMTVRVPSN